VPESVTSASTAVTAPASTTVPSCQTYFANKTYLHATSATVETDGSLELIVQTATVSCGGPDDYHYDVSATNETLRTVAHPEIEIFSIPEMRQVPIAPSQLPSYLPHPETGIFQVFGQPEAITALLEQFHP
jgi:hypothetical protein